MEEVSHRDKAGHMSWFVIFTVVLLVVLLVNKLYSSLMCASSFGDQYDMDHLNEVKIIKQEDEDGMWYYLYWTTPNPDVEVISDGGSTTITVAPYQCHTMKLHPGELDDGLKIVLKEKRWS